jgi:hypothetical protein
MTKMRRLSNVVKFMLLGVVTTMTLVACGGSSSSTQAPAATTVSGVAAAGAPIIGSVTIKDSTTPTAQTKTVPIAADGKYTVDVTGMKAPYMVRADGKVGGNDYHLYSAATTSDLGGTINITPLTDLIVANIAGSIAKTYFDNGGFSTLTAAELTTQSDALKAKLLPVLQALGVSSSIDLLRASFSADHTGLDSALDVLKVTTNTTTGVATITNIITQQQVASNTASVLTDTTGVATGITDIQSITKVFKTFSGLFATSLPSETNATLLSLLDSATFMNDGQNLASFLSDLTTDPTMVGISFANTTIQSIDPIAGTAVVAFDVIQAGKVTTDGPKPFHMIKKSGVWYLQGDQYVAHIRIRAVAQYLPSNTPATIYTGLNFDVEDRGGKGITSAVISGKGLTAPVTLVNQINNSWFTIQGNNNGNQYFMNDTQIAAIADTGEVYTVKLYIGSTLAATYTETIAKRPYLSSELTPATFPTITAPTLAALRAFNGGAITVNWTLPAGLTSNDLQVTLSDATGSKTAIAFYSPLPTATSYPANLTAITSGGTAFTPTNRMIWLNADDSYGRQLDVGMW